MPGRLQAEIKQSKPFQTVEEEALLNLARTLDCLEQPVHALLKGSGISRSQYNVLRILRGAGREGLPCGEVATRMVTRDPDITRLLDRMEQSGLVTRERERADRRVIRTRIARGGLLLLDELDEPLRELLRKLFGHMKKKDLETLVDLLERVRALE
jgi:DNA-binding MarR family transcriptional regulator